MANEEDVILLHQALRQGDAAWDAWGRRRPKFPDLRGIDLPGVDLRSFDLSLADLRRANLSRSNLTGADLSKADLSDAILAETMLITTKFVGAKLSGTNFRMAELRGADFREAELVKTIFGDVDLTDVSGLHQCTHSGPCIIDSQTLWKSGELPEEFLTGAGIPETLIQYLPSLVAPAIRLMIKNLKIKSTEIFCEPT